MSKTKLPPSWKQERMDEVVREIERKSLQEIAMIILQERFYSRQKQYECDFLDELANHLRYGDSFSDVELKREHYDEPMKELKQRYMNQ
tara:strand:- start:212 stop:478 length:267 start_codon:yes stop_codon:yes gene_type:complete